MVMLDSADDRHVEGGGDVSWDIGKDMNRMILTDKLGTGDNVGSGTWKELAQCLIGGVETGEQYDMEYLRVWSSIVDLE